MLVDHTNPNLDRIMGVMDVYFRAIDKNLACIGRIKAVQDIHQRGFASPVFAQ